MITEWFITVGLGFVQWLVDLFPDWSAPSEFTNLDSRINGFFAQFNGLGVWAPWGLIATCVGIALAVWGIGFVIKLARAVASYLPFFGGAG